MGELGKLQTLELMDQTRSAVESWHCWHWWNWQSAWPPTAANSNQFEVVWRSPQMPHCLKRRNSATCLATDPGETLYEQPGWEPLKPMQAASKAAVYRF